MSNLDLSQQIINSGYDIFFLTTDQFLNIDSNFGLSNFFSLYRQDTGTQNSGQLLALPDTIDFIEKTASTNHHQIAIAPFKPSAKTEHICRQNNWKYLANPSTLNRHLEDKLNFVNICRQHHIPTLPSYVAPLTPKNFRHSQQLFGQSKLVIQTHFGWAGQSTFTASNYSQVATIIPSNTPVKYCPYLSGYTLINNCCQTRLGLLMSPPALQFTGIPKLTTNPFSTVGRQWPSFSSPSVINRIKEITMSVSHLLINLKYQGFFGLDFFVDSHQQPYLLEINPRLTASYSFYTQLEIKANLTPLFFHHLAAFLELQYQFSPKTQQEKIDYANIQGSEVTPKDDHGHTVKRLHFPKPLSSSTDALQITRSLHALQI